MPKFLNFIANASGSSPVTDRHLHRAAGGVNQVRARKSSRNPVIRLLLVGLAFVLFNLYISLRLNLPSALKHPLQLPKRFWFSLRRLALLLSRAIERLWGSTDVIQYQPCFMLS